jgi:hypothetical protein
MLFLSSCLFVWVGSPFGEVDNYWGGGISWSLRWVGRITNVDIQLKRGSPFWF